MIVDFELMVNWVRFDGYLILLNQLLSLYEVKFCYVHLFGSVAKELQWKQWRSNLCIGARGSVVGWGTMLQAGKVSGSSPDEVDFFFQIT
jgi:hypothetical protein